MREADVIDYFVAIDNVLIQFETISVNPTLHCQAIISGLAGECDFRRRIEIEAKQQNINVVEDLQSLILQEALAIERAYVPPSRRPGYVTSTHPDHSRSSQKPQAVPARFEAAPARFEAVPAPQAKFTAPTGARSGDHSRVRPTSKCFNCGGPHLLKDCTTPINQALTDANRAAYLERQRNRRRYRDTQRVSTIGEGIRAGNPSLPVTDNVIVSSHAKGILEDISTNIVVHIDSGASVSIIKPNIAQCLQEAGCPYRRVRKRIQGFNGGTVDITTQLLNVRLKVTSVAGPVSLVVNPFVASGPDDLIMDKVTAVKAGLLEIKVPPEELVLNRSGVDCHYCGAVCSIDTIPEEEVETKPDIATAIVDQDALTATIGPNVNREKMMLVLERNVLAFQPHFHEAVEHEHSFRIEVRDPTLLPRKGPRRLSRNDSLIVDQQVQELVSLGIIRPSSSSVSSPIVLVKYADKSSRLCVDYRELNAATTDLRYPTRNLREVVDRIAGKRFLGKIDLFKGYHQIAMDPSSIYLTAFATNKGLFEYVRLPFGLKNAPSAFQQHMDRVFADLLFRICEIYLDDIIIFGDTEDDFLQNVETVLKRLIDARLTAKVSKCLFGYLELPFLGFLVSSTGYRMDPSRSEAVTKMSPPESRKQLRSFLGLINYFASFIPGLAGLSRPLYELCHSDQPFEWSQSLLSSFKDIINQVAHAPALTFINYDHPVIIRTDASDIAVGGVLFQEYAGTTHFVQFWSKAFTGAEKSWCTIEKEAFAMYYGILHCRHFVSGHHFILETDHRNLVYLHRAEVPKLVRWRLRLQEFDFEVRHIPGATNLVADILSRPCGDCVSALQDLAPSEMTDHIRRVHNSTVGHRGVATTIRILREGGITWNRMHFDVSEFIRQCPTCQKQNPRFKAPSGPSGSLMVYEPFQRLCMDFIGPLPMNEDGKIFLLVIVDAFSRWTELFPMPEATAEATAACLLQVLSRFGIPEEILSDNGPQFVSKVLKDLMRLWDVHHIFSTPHHHEGNGLVERCNREVMRHLRNIVFDEELYTSWVAIVPRVQYILNSQVHSATGYSPIQMVFGSAVSPVRGLSGTKFRSSLEQSTVEYLAEKYARVDEILKKARENQLQVEEREFQKGEELPEEFHVNEWVLVDYPTGAPTKLHPKRAGPYQVLSKNWRSYNVLNINTGKKYKVDMSRLTRFHVGDHTLEDIAKLLHKDMQEFLVEAILDHRGSPNKWEFLVRWKGYGPEDDTWEPIANLQHNAQFKEYLKIHKLKIRPSHSLQNDRST